MDTTHREPLPAVLDGLLRIVDADAFRAAVIAGIGPGQAFGFGLLSFAPV